MKISKILFFILSTFDCNKPLLNRWYRPDWVFRVCFSNKPLINHQFPSRKPSIGNGSKVMSTSMPTTLPRNCDISKALASLEKRSCLYYIYSKCDNTVILL